MGSEDRCRERGYVGTINGEPNACNDEEKVERVVAKMKMAMIDDKVKKMITRIQEVSDAMMSNQLRTVIAEIQEDGGDGRGEIYKDEGAALHDMFEDGEAGLDNGHRHQGHQRQQLLPSGRSQTGGGPRLRPRHSSAEHRCRWFHSAPPGSL